MTGSALHAALERRYDGPLPRNPSAWPDYDTSWPLQCRVRRHLAWRAVRTASRTAIAAKRHFRTLPSVETYRLWRVRRHALAHALGGWRYFRDLDRR